MTLTPKKAAAAARHNADRDAAFSKMALDLIERVLSHSGDVGSIPLNILLQMRELTGARCAALQRQAGPSRWQTVTVLPDRRSAWLDEAPVKQLCERCDAEHPLVFERLNLRHLNSGECGDSHSFAIRLPCAELGEGRMILLDLPKGNEGPVTEVLELMVPSLSLAFQIALRYLDQRDDLRARSHALEASEHTLAHIAQQSTDIIFVTNLEGKAHFISPSAMHLLGVDEQAFFSGSALDLIASEDLPKLQQAVARLASGQAVQDLTVTFVRPDGQSRILEVNASPVRTEGQVSGSQGVARDITERRLLETELRQAQKLEAIGQLAGGVAHDFNNLLTCILGNASLLAEELSEDSPVCPERTELVDDVIAAGKRASELTSQLLAFSRRQALEVRDHDLNDIVGSMSRMLRRLLGEHIDLQTRFGATSVPALVDRGQIEQVLLNLAINARDAMPRGGRLSIETELGEAAASQWKQLDGTTPGRCATLRVIDDGCGMADEVRERIFEPFFTTKNHKGTGLGLAMVYGIIRQHGGVIFVSSKPGKGSCFEIQFPEGQLEAHALEASSAEAKFIAKNSERVLLVEDEATVRRVTRRMLTALSYQVHVADGVDAALRLLTENATHYDLVLSDVIMPGRSGRDLAEIIAQRWPKLRVALMSGHEDKTLLEQGFEASTVPLLRKPFDQMKLGAYLRHVLKPKD